MSTFPRMKLRFVRNLPLQYGANEAADRDDPNDPRYVRITDVTQDGLLRPETFKSLPLHLARPYLLADGDLLLARSGATVGKVFMYQSHWGRCCFAGYLIRLSVDRRRALPRFVWWYTQSKLWVQEVQLSNIQATIQNVSAERYGEFGMPRPSLPTQQAIAVFLDRKTAAIDALIEKKQKLLALLAEKRAALINQAVTKGLDPNVPMRDSGVAWIGEIPAHWEVVPLRLYAKVIDCKHRTPEYIEEGFPIVSTTEVKPGRLDLTPVTRRVGEADFQDMTQNRTPTRGDIIYSRNASLGAAAYVDTDEPFAMGQDVVLITKPDLDLLYLSYQLNSLVGMTQVDLVCIGSTFKRINVGQIKQIQVCGPPPAEAEQIAAFIDHEEQRQESLRKSLERHLERLQEYRQALITAAVTGQLGIDEETSHGAFPLEA